MIKDTLKKYLTIGSFVLAGANFYSGSKADFSSDKEILNPSSKEYLKDISKNYFENAGKYTSFEKAKEQYESYKKLELERMLKEEKSRKLEEFSKPFYLTADSLNAVMKQASEEMKKEGKSWPKEFDKKLFKKMLKNESHYNIYAISPTGYMGLSQIGYSLLETLRPEKWKEFKNPVTGEIDTLAVKKYVFDPVESVKLGAEGLEYMKDFCIKYDSTWKDSDLKTKREKILFCYNAGIGTAQKYDFDHTNKELPEENRKYPEKILGDEKGED